jgi:hypothetical protein
LCILVGDPPDFERIRWSRDLPWPSTPVCLHCLKYIALALATPPRHHYLSRDETAEEPDQVASRPGPRRVETVEHGPGRVF